MTISHKDKSLLLFIVALIIIVWGIFSVLSNIILTTSFQNSDAAKIIIDKDKEWLNVEQPLTELNLKNRVILLDFWTYACVSCVQSLPEIKKLEEKYGGKLTVIGVHSRKFDNEKDHESIKKAVLKYDITHPVINDADLKVWNRFGVKSWPTYILINPRGKVVKTYVGVDKFDKINKDVSKIISKFKYQINRDVLPILSEKHSVIANVLEFPTKLEYSSNFSYKKAENLPVIFIANTGGNSVVVTSLKGKIITEIGSRDGGFEDGDFKDAKFSAPKGLLYKDQKLYIADSGNHALRVIDFKKETVSTISGSGQRGDLIEGLNSIKASEIDLSSPSDLEFFPDKNNIVISNSGTHQILSYNIKKKKISLLAGSGEEGIDDGKKSKNSLSQTADISIYNNKLYFIDSGTSSLRVMDKEGNVKTLIGKGFDSFGHKNGNKKKALMQHPLGLTVDNTGAYISDSFNHVIRKYNFSSEKITDLAGKSNRGDAIGAKKLLEFDEPEGLLSIRDQIYIADSNNNRIVILNKKDLSSKILDVIPPLKLSTESLLQYLPNLKKAPDAIVKSNSNIVARIDLKKGWKINELGPSFINLLELVRDDQANLIANYDWRVVKTKEMILPKLKTENDYILQGVIYYCEDKKNALCYIKSYEQKIVADSDEKKSTEINIKLGY